MTFTAALADPSRDAVALLTFRIKHQPLFAPVFCFFLSPLCQISLTYMAFLPLCVRSQRLHSCALQWLAGPLTNVYFA